MIRLIERWLCAIGLHSWEPAIIRHAAPKWWTDAGHCAWEFKGAIPIHGMRCRRCWVSDR